VFTQLATDPLPRLDVRERREPHPSGDSTNRPFNDGPHPVDSVLFSRRHRRVSVASKANATRTLLGLGVKV
jgi:hypothetical protein